MFTLQWPLLKFESIYALGVKEYNIESMNTKNSLHANNFFENICIGARLKRRYIYSCDSVF